MMGLNSFYTEVMNCPLTRSECPHAVRSLKKGDVPRGFHFRKGVRPDVLVVAKNPGHASDRERAYYKDKAGRGLLKAHLKYHKDRRSQIVQGLRKSNRFDTNRRRYLLYILGFHKKLVNYKKYMMDGNDEGRILSKCFFTNLFKCSTEDEQMPINDETFSVCYNQHFLRELSIIRPKVIIAVGREVSRFLRRHSSSGEIAVPVVPIKHFSYFYAKGKEQMAMRRVRHAVRKAIMETTS